MNRWIAHLLRWPVISLILSPSAASASGQSFWGQFKDPTDKALDLTTWLSKQSGFIPLPLVITDPAVGYGGGLSLIFLHGSIAEEVPSGKPVFRVETRRAYARGPS